MNKDKIPYAIEGILFAAGEPVKTAKIAAVLEIDIEAVEEAVRILKYEYDTQERGFMIIDIDEGYQICSRPEYYNYIQVILGDQRRQALSNAAMEALAIIAYKQPVTRSEIESIRGIKCERVIEGLAKKELIEEKGRSNGIGRPILYGTTKLFLEKFGFETLKDLPDIEEIDTLIGRDEDEEALETLDALGFQQISLDLNE